MFYCLVLFTEPRDAKNLFISDAYNISLSIMVLKLTGKLIHILLWQHVRNLLIVYQFLSLPQHNIWSALFGFPLNISRVNKSDFERVNYHKSSCRDNFLIVFIITPYFWVEHQYMVRVPNSVPSATHRNLPTICYNIRERTLILPYVKPCKVKMFPP